MFSFTLLISLITKKKHESSASTVTFCSVLCRRLAAEVLQDGVQVPLHHRRNQWWMLCWNGCWSWMFMIDFEIFSYEKGIKRLEDDCFRTSWSRKVYSALSLSLYHWNLTSHFCKMDLSYRDLRAEIAMWATTKITHGWMWCFPGKNLAGNPYLVGDCNFLALFVKKAPIYLPKNWLKAKKSWGCCYSYIRKVVSVGSTSGADASDFSQWRWAWQPPSSIQVDVVYILTNQQRLTLRGFPALASHS